MCVCVCVSGFAVVYVVRRVMAVAPIAAVGYCLHLIDLMDLAAHSCTHAVAARALAACVCVCVASPRPRSMPMLT